jgi:hypothetical protein
MRTIFKTGLVCLCCAAAFLQIERANAASCYANIKVLDGGAEKTLQRLSGTVYLGGFACKLNIPVTIKPKLNAQGGCEVAAAVTNITGTYKPYPNPTIHYYVTKNGTKDSGEKTKSLPTGFDCSTKSVESGEIIGVTPYDKE